MWNISKAQSCADYLKFHASPDTAASIVVNNYGGKFLGYIGTSPDYILWRYCFKDSYISLRFYRDMQEDRRVEIFVDGKSVAII